MSHYDELIEEQRQTEQNREYQIKIVENESRLIDVDMDEFDIEEQSHF